MLPLDQNVLSLGDCIDLDDNPRNPEIEARRYHTFIVGNEWTHAAVPDTTVTPELSVTVGTDLGTTLHARVLPESQII